MMVRDQTKVRRALLGFAVVGAAVGFAAGSWMASPRAAVTPGSIQAGTYYLLDTLPSEGPAISYRIVHVGPNVRFDRPGLHCAPTQGRE